MEALWRDNLTPASCFSPDAGSIFSVTGSNRFLTKITLTNNRELIQRKQIMSSSETLNPFPEQLFFLGAHGRSEFQSFFAVVLAAPCTLKTPWRGHLHWLIWHNTRLPRFRAMVGFSLEWRRIQRAHSKRESQKGTWRTGSPAQTE